MEIEYEIHIGELTELPNRNIVPKQKLLISKEQYDIIQTFANIEMTDELNKIYILNNCRFKIIPHFKHG